MNTNITTAMKNILLPIVLCAVTSSAFALQAAAPSISPAGGVYDSTQLVSLSSATSGASIAYTTDGSIPTESGGAVTNGTLYSGPVSIGTTTIVSAIAFAPGYADSGVNISGYTIHVFSPVFSPSAGDFASLQTVTITTATSGASIRYTIDGSAPTETHGILYSGPVQVSSTTTFQAIAYKVGVSDSPVVSGLFTITDPSSGNLMANEPLLMPFVQPATLNVLYNFTVSNSSIGNPNAGLVQGTDGNFYGTAEAGGSGANGGGVFKITSSGSLTALVSFTGTNGDNPGAALVQGTDGNFYGTTSLGGSGYGSIGPNTLGDGTVFKITPSGTLTTLVSFTGANGAEPQSTLVQGTDGNFYGTTSIGGTSNDGTVFKITPAGVLTTLYSFSGADGNQPDAGVVQGTDGNFYGTTGLGGTSNDGTVFKITPAGALTTLFSFAGANGIQPAASLLQFSDGNFYGTTYHGGAHANGTVFKITPAGVLTTLYSFGGTTDGALPDAPLVVGIDGNFYGTTVAGGDSNNDGTIFQITPAGVLTTLVTFAGTNGTGPFGIVLGSDGNFYGTTGFGASTGAGNVFQLIYVPQAGAPSFSPAAGTFTSAQTVTITTTTSGASIRYTTDGSTPTETNGTLYSSPVSISSTTTLMAIAYKAGITDSTVTSGTYTINIPAPPPPPPPASGGGGGGAPSYWFLAFLAAAGLLRWRFRQAQAI
jgi:MYXO-CTERM domain-containing protein